MGADTVTQGLDRNVEGAAVVEVERRSIGGGGCAVRFALPMACVAVDPRPSRDVVRTSLTVLPLTVPRLEGLIFAARCLAPR